MQQFRGKNEVTVIGFCRIFLCQSPTNNANHAWHATRRKCIIVKVQHIDKQFCKYHVDISSTIDRRTFWSCAIGFYWYVTLFDYFLISMKSKSWKSPMKKYAWVFAAYAIFICGLDVAMRPTLLYNSYVTVLGFAHPSGCFVACAAPERRPNVRKFIANWYIVKIS